MDGTASILQTSNTAVQLLPACLSTCLPACLSASFSVCLSVVCLLLFFISFKRSLSPSEWLHPQSQSHSDSQSYSDSHSLMPNAQKDAASQAAKNIFSFAALSFKTAVEAGQVMTSSVCLCVCVCVYIYECLPHQVMSGQVALHGSLSFSLSGSF